MKSSCTFYMFLSIERLVPKTVKVKLEYEVTNKHDQSKGKNQVSYDNSLIYGPILQQLPTK